MCGRQSIFFVSVPMTLFRKKYFNLSHLHNLRETAGLHRTPTPAIQTEHKYLEERRVIKHSRFVITTLSSWMQTFEPGRYQFYTGNSLNITELGVRKNLTENRGKMGVN